MRGSNQPIPFSPFSFSLVEMCEYVVFFFLPFSFFILCMLKLTSGFIALYHCLPTPSCTVSTAALSLHLASFALANVYIHILALLYSSMSRQKQICLDK